jgi:two-component system chemotaxis sensor kinase CheA
MEVNWMDTSQYLSLFLEESEENIENLNQSMLELEKNPEDIEIISEIFRYAHTLKGMSATMGYNNLAELTHNMENVLDKLRNKELKASTGLVTVLFECVDMLEKMIGNIADGGDDKMDTSAIVSKLANVGNDENAKEAPPEQASEDGKSNLELNVYDKNVLKEAKNKLYNAYEITVELRKDCQLKAARAFVVFNNLQQYGEIVKSNPPAEDLEKEKFGHTITLVYLTQTNKEFIKDLINNISEIDFCSVDEVDPKKYSDSVKIEAATAQKVQTKAKKAPQPSKKAQAGTHTRKLGQSVRVDLDRLDKFMNLVGELVIHRTRLEQISESNHITELNETLEQIGRVTSDLQDLVMKVRMIPLEQVFSRLPRMMRDLSTELDKQIDFVMKGQETELDRTVIDELGESIIHLLRNSVDHGIESKEERINAGKDPVGHVTVTAYQEGNKAVIKVEDDGRGLDIEKIKEKAQEKGIDTTGMSDVDIQNLIFVEGFSTSDKVTDISGRGVGMGVVKTKVTSVGGSVDVKSEVGRGTTFTIYLPLTLSIIQALLVKVKDETFAISLGFIEKVIKINKDDIKYSNNREVIVYRDQIIRALRLSEKLHIESDNKSEGFVVIVKLGEKHLGLIVDSLVGQQEIVIKPLGKSLKGLKQYVGSTILGDGRVTLILDIVSIISER